RKFYYKDSTVGAYTITIKVVSGVSCANLAGQEAQWTAEQNIIISDSISTTVVESTAQQTQTTTVVVWPTEPQIFADAGKDKTGVAGADIKFSGQSIGLNDKPLENARYIWTFGDGAKAEGKNVLHFYYYPGEYIAVLNIASGEYSASDRILVKIFPNQLIISETNKDYIKLQNDSKNELDISGWFLGANGKFFRFPETTLIKSNTNLLISSAISGLNTDNQKPSLFYPNGSIAYIYNKTSPPTPLLRGEGGSLSEPGEVNEIVKYSVSNNLEEEIVTTSTKQTANIITSTQNNSLGLKKWLMMIGGLIVLAVAGLFIIRRQSAI
ncbi:MAG: PKD domain-containing protein, partial [Patescibacteria group bacterium]